MDKLIIRPLGNAFFRAMHQQTYESFGDRVKTIHWVECDVDGNISDGNKDGNLQNKLQVCKLKEGQEDIDISKLSQDCLNNLG